MYHAQVIWKALCFLWGVKSIVWGPDRLRLWRKAVNLYLSFLAFTDKERPVVQLERAMTCAVLSAVYDYDSDHEFGERDGRSFRATLHALVDSAEVRHIAITLFEKDVAGTFSVDGLERGSEALRVYRLVIGSDWMRVFSDEEIERYGRRLQMIDDLLDLQNDRLVGDANCFLGAESQSEHVAEVRAFIESDFFKHLEERSRVYGSIKRKTQETLQQFGGTLSFKHLAHTGRPHTGLYAFLLALVSFGFFGWKDWPVALLTSVVFGLLTMSIMTFNDYVDRDHDVKKGKTFARDYRDALWRFWRSEALAVLVLLTALMYIAPHVAAFCLLVWLVGLWYSFIPHWFLVQNVLVALCSGSPALCGMVNAMMWDAKSVATFTLFTALILFSEVNKDIEDHTIDIGYKSTVPVKWGARPASLLLIMSVHLVALPFLFYPDWWVFAVGLVALPNLSRQQAFTFLNWRRVKRPINAVVFTIKLLGIVLYLRYL